MWVLLPGVVHLYPTLLQRSILLHLQPLLDRVPAATPESAYRIIPSQRQRC